MHNDTFSADIQLLARAVDAAGSSLIITDHQLPDYPVIFCNAAFERLTGYSRQEILGRNCRFLQGSESGQPGIKEIRVALAAGIPCTTAIRNYRKDGRPFWNELVLSPVHDDQGRITHFIGIQHDITDRMVGRDARLDRFNLASHEMKTPLTTIKSTLQILQRRGLAIEEQFFKRSLAAALLAVERIEKLAGELFY